jgi:hypothetical protein
MKRHDFWMVLVSFVALQFTTACGGSPDDTDLRLGEAPSAALNANALNANALNANALNANGLYAGALSPATLGQAPLDPDWLGPSALAALADSGPRGELSRQLVKYAVGCAFDATQSFSVHWVDGVGTAHDDTYTGLLGLATSWAYRPLSSRSAQKVSACLIARVNYLGVSVTISSRGDDPGLAATAAELAAFTRQEGAFWGNVFTATPTAYACDFRENDAHSRAAGRYCAAGYDDGSGTLQGCGIIQRVGSCAAACGALGPSGYYPACSGDGGGSYSYQVITVFLP